MSIFPSHEITTRDTGAPPRILAVVGPTGSGKTALALRLAEQLGTEIIAADSMQFYRGMEIGTAAPTAEERARVPHHFVGILNPSQRLPAGEYGPAARACAETLEAQDKVPVLCGGSGMYVQAVLDGIFEGPGRDPVVRAALQAEVEALGNAALLERLRHIDPDYAAVVGSPNDVVRILRALEVHTVTGIPLSTWHREHRATTPALPALVVAVDYPDRAALYARIDQRVEAMIAAGWVSEVEALLAAGYETDLLALKALGYTVLAAHLRGEQSLASAVAAIQKYHRNYAKRQLTWFRNDPRVVWLPAPEDGNTAALAETVLAQWRGRGGRRTAR